MIGVSVKGADALAGKLRTLGARTGDATLDGVRRGTAMLESALKRELRQPAASDAFWGKMGAKGDGLAVRTGGTYESITGGSTAYRVGDTVIGAVGSGRESLKRHEEGGTFHGTSPKGYARIPTGLAKTGAGAEKGEFSGKSIRDMAGVFLFTSKAGKLWAARKAGKGKVELLYLLVKEYTLRPRHIFQRVRDQQAAAVTEGLRASVAVQIKGSGL